MSSSHSNARPTIYVPKAKPIEAMKLYPANASIIAAWCGGEIVEEGKSSDPKDIYVGVNVPTIEGVKRLQVGQYLSRDKDTGRFNIQNANEFESFWVQNPTAYRPPSIEPHVRSETRPRPETRIFSPEDQF